MKDRELIARIIINILDVKNCQQWELFTGEDMYEQVCNYILNISKGNNTAEEYARKMMEENKPVIDRIVQGEDIPNEEYNVFIRCFLLVNQIFLFDNWLKFVTGSFIRHIGNLNKQNRSIFFIYD